MIKEIIEELENLKECYNGTGKAVYKPMSFDSYIQYIIDMAKKHANDGWHVAADGDLPKESGHYLTTYYERSNGNFLPEFDSKTIKKLHYSVNTGWRYPVCCSKEAESDMHREVIAWQELPPKYIPKEHKEDNEKDCRKCNHKEESYCNGCENYSKFVK